MSGREAPIVGFLSGKGGVGKTNAATNVAVACRGRGARVLLVDGDLGLANVDTLLGLLPSHTAVDLLEGRCKLEEAVLEGPRGVHVLPAARGRRGLSDCRPHELAGLLLPLLEASDRYDLVLLDLGTGIGDTAVGLSACCDLAVVVTTPELPSLVDSYAMLKVLATEAPELPVEILVNAGRNEAEARRVHEQLVQICERFLARSPGFLDFVPIDARLAEAVRLQQAVVERFPTSRSSRGFSRIAERLLRQPRVRPPCAVPVGSELSGGAPS
ncbi:MAG: P-loop NTPase [Myxococcales bacterium]|nr:P-loop NTPase [Myxococcales bacterium]